MALTLQPDLQQQLLSLAARRSALACGANGKGAAQPRRNLYRVPFVPMPARSAVTGNQERGDLSGYSKTPATRSSTNSSSFMASSSR